MFMDSKVTFLVNQDFEYALKDGIYVLKSVHYILQRKNVKAVK